MEDLAEYHGRISRRQAEEILNEAGRDGSYLIRDSASAAGSYCVCVLCDGWVYTYRVFKQKDALWTIAVAPGMKERLFRNVGNLIAAFKFPDQGISVPLLYPVNRTNKRAGNMLMFHVDINMKRPGIRFKNDSFQ
uniref:SH2 domain containing 1A duplicate a n=1 Tax=Sinocyclocheilus grahami TaxID=75366 RepID=A0A672NLX4_SINGR